MIMKYMGKLLFPRLHPSQRLHEVKMLLLASCIAAAFGVVLVAVILTKNAAGR
jgi:hypothetical protein